MIINNNNHIMIVRDYYKINAKLIAIYFVLFYFATVLHDQNYISNRFLGL